MEIKSSYIYNMIDAINTAVSKGAKLFANVSGGKDGQAMVKTLVNNGFKIASLLHCDLGRIEWEASMKMCTEQANEIQTQFNVITRKDGRGMIEHWKNRMDKLKGQNKPFWSSSQARYCTSDMKRDPTDVFYRNCGNDLIISCEGIRAEESKERAKKNPLSVRTRCSHKFYKDMTAEEAIAAFVPGKRLALTWYPIFNFTIGEVFATYDNTVKQLNEYRAEYKTTGAVNTAWKFHPAYVYGNERVSCMFCVLGCKSDLQNAAYIAPEILAELINMETESGFTFKNDFSLTELLKSKTFN